MRMARERGKEWRRVHPRVPPNVDIDTLGTLAYGSIPADLLGFTDERMKQDIRSEAVQFSAEDYLWFDPTKEGVPADLRDGCE
jgi:hypothetical protein